jgi:alkaline phosphatase D
VRIDPPDGPDVVLYRSVAVGDLARIHLLDERQYSEIPPCRPEPTDTNDFGDCPARTDERTLLGAEQESFLADSVNEGGVTWDLFGNPGVLAGVDAGTDTPAYYLDTWDGYPTARQRLIELLAATPNPVVLTGDYHAGMTLDVHATPFDTSTPVVAPEFMAPAISSPLFPADVSGRTPHLREQLNGHGYLVVDVEPERVTARFNIVADVQDVASPIEMASTWTVQVGSRVAERA